MPKSNAAVALSWDPVASGKLYCAPACGRGCTRTEYAHAVEVAADLARRLGPGWRPNVWENMGWHASAVNATGFWKVHPFTVSRTPRFYTAFLGEGETGGRWAESGRTPQLAIRRTRAKARTEYNAIALLLVTS